MKIIYERTPKSVIIKAYRKKLKASGSYTTRYNTSDCVPSLVRPVVMGKSMSWVEFGRLPREVVAYHCFIAGLTIDGILTINEEEE